MSFGQKAFGQKSFGQTSWLKVIAPIPSLSIAPIPLNDINIRKLQYLACHELFGLIQIELIRMATGY